jgi:hypothetical protein
MRPSPAKIIVHSEGMGVPSSETVRKRAEELARIDGRTEYNDNDWRQAKLELHGGHDLNGNSSDAEMAALVSEHDMVVTDIGHHVQNMGPDDNESFVEELIAEGMDEAIHEQMLAAAGVVEDEATEDNEEEDEEG